MVSGGVRFLRFETVTPFPDDGRAERVLELLEGVL
jgi:hypothetical protein